MLRMYLLELNTAESADVCILISSGLPYLFIANKYSYHEAFLLQIDLGNVGSPATQQRKWVLKDGEAGGPTRKAHFQFLFLSNYHNQPGLLPDVSALCLGRAVGCDGPKDHTMEAPCLGH